ncbi:phosphoenolpyruvate--protein phosphotransferase [Tichowtungia aerotolerans]|uniref:Phosphoenolpyruvate-protein phosphotransferase n=1 Tax=Tichowtungia aerotolerans TaxID=2697043 RepID=A0A6P1M8N2_9BACT|nr:phosphoenolpyruvate--protein phosphotransferase [Tichowtungia aerotolerans]QHI70257.1 phosphoenolpyruvate--protein phosphotransferase [Tichowtungia aerotolerans]
MSVEASEGLEELVLQGIGVSPGVAVGDAVVFASEGFAVPERNISESEIPLEIARFEEALIKTRHQISEIQHNVEIMLGSEHAGIFDAHLLVVDDRYFIEEVIRSLRENRRNVESIVNEVSGNYTSMLAKVEDDYLRERAADVHDVTRRIVKNLAGEGMDRLNCLEHPCIAVAHDFSPSDTAGMNRDIVQALVADIGSSTSHAAIMARALEVPAVVGLHDVSTRINAGDTVLVDGAKGVVVIRPSSATLLTYAQRAEELKMILGELETLKDEQSETKDGYCVPIAANIELPNEIVSIDRFGAQGIGLFRTEFLFQKKQLPDEETQIQVYSEAADQCGGNEVVIRTLDLGGDKCSAGIRVDQEANPFLGWRAIRFCLGSVKLFKVQLRAILRAAAGRNIAMMYPMISCVSEVLEANTLLEECRQELKSEGLPCADRIKIGVLIEVPSAALTVDLIAPHVDFFSIGTNDLIQYTLAIDRVNEKVAHLYRPTHASVIRLIHQVVQTGQQYRIPVMVCGQTAASPELAPLLIGLGVNRLSISPPSVPMIKDVIRNLHYSDCRRLAEDALRMSSSEDIAAECRALLKKTSPEILELIS